MIQGNLTKLDNDFITIWSNYMLYREIDREALRKLAELGQVNAVQSYYLFFTDRNSKVDEIVNNYTSINPDEHFAKANKLRLDNPEDVKKADELVEEISDLYDEIYDLQIDYNNTSNYDTAELNRIENEINRKREKRDDLQSQYDNLPFIKFKKESIRDYWNIGVQTKNPLFNERAVEIQRSMPLADIGDLKKCIKITRKGLIKRYKKDKEDIAVQFALAKNLIMFKAPDKQKELANILLKKLSQRELSKEVQDYSENHTHVFSEDEDALPCIDD